MNATVSKVLNFFNLLDSDNNLSITNIIVIGCFIKLMIEQQPDLSVIIAMLGVLLNYGHKRFMNAKKSQASEELGGMKEQLTAIENKTDSLLNDYNRNSIVIQQALDDHTDAIGRINTIVNGS